MQTGEHEIGGIRTKNDHEAGNFLRALECTEQRFICLSVRTAIEKLQTTLRKKVPYGSTNGRRPFYYIEAHPFRPCRLQDW